MKHTNGCYSSNLIGCRYNQSRLLNGKPRFIDCKPIESDMQPCDLCKKPCIPDFCGGCGNGYCSNCRVTHKGKCFSIKHKMTVFHADTAPEPQQDTKEWERLNGKNVDTAGMTMEPQQDRKKLLRLMRDQYDTTDTLNEMLSKFADAILAAYRLEKR